MREVFPCSESREGEKAVGCMDISKGKRKNDLTQVMGIWEAWQATRALQDPKVFKENDVFLLRGNPMKKY